VQARAPVVSREAVIAVGLGVIGLYVLAFIFLMNRTSYDTWGAMAIGPILFALTLPALARQAARENDRRLFWLLCLALLVKIAATLIRYYVIFEIYGGRADAKGYAGQGTRIAENFLHGDFSTHLEDFSGTNFIVLLTGIVFTITRPTLIGGFLVYSWLAFVGMFLFYRAFTIAVPDGRTRTYARLLFFVPSMLFWPASIGKESVMVFALGLGAYGVAHILTHQTVKGLVLLVAGLWPAAVVRPHMAGMMAIALVVAILVQPVRAKGRQLALAIRVTTLLLMLVMSAFLVGQTQEFLKAESISEALSQTTEVTSKGGSEFKPIAFLTPIGAPLATFQVLFRPTLLDAHNSQAILAGVEGTFLFLLTLFRWRWVWAAVKRLRRTPYIAFVGAYTGMFVIAYSSFANFGILARERVQLLPLFFVLLSIPPRPRERGDDRASARPDALAGSSTRGG
jgi:hypothetical protein